MTQPTTPDANKILWVEDDYFLMRLIAQRLTQENYVLFHANDGKSALQLAKKEKPDIIMLDILLTGMDGIEMLRELKKDPATQSIPVIMFSNVSDPEKVKVSKELGAVGFFVKAYVTLDEILAEIKKATAAS